MSRPSERSTRTPRPPSWRTRCGSPTGSGPTRTPPTRRWTAPGGRPEASRSARPLRRPGRPIRPRRPPAGPRLRGPRRRGSIWPSRMCPPPRSRSACPLFRRCRARFPCPGLCVRCARPSRR
ncbi:hypothetical protein E1281_25230 [Actinomadura sp. KC345]|nr:hypothetical protein E1281_25230 [Actinomadura sp. KC345]